MRKQFVFLFLFLPFIAVAQTKQEIVIPPSKDTVVVTITTYPAKTDYVLTNRSTTPGNKPPIADAGNDMAITLPTNTVTLSAVGSADADGSIASYKWEKLSGGTASLIQINTALNVSGLTQGVYVFRVTVVDNGGLSDNDDVTVTVNPAPSEPGTRNNLVFSALFNGSNPFPSSELYKQACCSYSVTQSKSVVREGDGSFRAESRVGENSVSEGYRPEFIPPTNTRLTDGWYGYSVYLQDWSATSGGEHIMQWHPNDGKGSAVLALWTAGNTFNVNLNASGGTSSSGLKSLANSITIKANKWYDFVWHVVWSSDRTKGRIEVWVDGQKYLDYTGVTLPPSGIPYFKIGINRWNLNDSRVLYIDAVRIGNSSATYKDVAP